MYLEVQVSQNQKRPLLLTNQNRAQMRLFQVSHQTTLTKLITPDGKGHLDLAASWEITRELLLVSQKDLLRTCWLHSTKQQSTHNCSEPRQDARPETLHKNRMNLTMIPYRKATQGKSKTLAPLLAPRNESPTTTLEMTPFGIDQQHQNANPTLIPAPCQPLAPYQQLTI